MHRPRRWRCILVHRQWPSTRSCGPPSDATSCLEDGVAWCVSGICIRYFSVQRGRQRHTGVEGGGPWMARGGGAATAEGGRTAFSLSAAPRRRHRRHQGRSFLSLDRLLSVRHGAPPCTAALHGSTSRRHALASATGQVGEAHDPDLHAATAPLLKRGLNSSNGAERGRMVVVVRGRGGGRRADGGSTTACAHSRTRVSCVSLSSLCGPSTARAR